MSREIKFRAWDKVDQKFFPIRNLVYVNGNLLGINFGMASPKNKRMERQVDLMQFTGLLDKNRKEIYEGDIILSGQPVVWKNDGWGIPSGKYSLSTYSGRSEFEVIGNIYENPELLST